jgi:hypothetical protein
MTTTHTSVTPRKRRGEKLTGRDAQRDDVMKLIFARPGFAADVARALDVTHQNVSGWNRVPAHHVIDVAIMLEMTPEQIRPDIFGRSRK